MSYFLFIIDLMTVEISHCKPQICKLYVSLPLCAVNFAYFLFTDSTSYCLKTPLIVCIINDCLNDPCLSGTFWSYLLIQQVAMSKYLREGIGFFPCVIKGRWWKCMAKKTIINISQLKLLSVLKKRINRKCRIS